MRAAAILGLGCSPRNLNPLQLDSTVEWQVGMPGSKEQADVIVLFGGDGTVHRHLGELARLGLPVLIVPAGSGNDFAHSLGLHSVKDSLAEWKKFCAAAGNVREIDLGVITEPSLAGEAPTPRNSRYFCCMAGVGIDAEVARRANRLPRWLRGHGGYAISVLPSIFSFKALEMKILTRSDSPQQSEPWAVRSDKPLLMAAFANTSRYGGGMKIAPEAKMEDGLLDICTVGAVPPLRLLRLFPTVYRGQHLKIPEVEYFKASGVRIETEHPAEVYADGEYVCRTPVEIGVERGALKLIVP